MEIIKKGKKILIDDEDGHLVSKGYLFIEKYGGVILAKWEDGKQRRYYLSRIIMDCPKGLVVDHINHNKLDNRKQNLRVCTSRENNLNRVPFSEHGLKGVHKAPRGKLWSAQIGFKTNRIGYYKTKEEAAKAYNIIARFLYGEFAWLNPV